MRLHEIIPNDPLLEDLSRRGFLKGLGATAGIGGIGYLGRPLQPTRPVTYTVFGDGKFITQVQATSPEDAENQVKNNPKFNTNQYKVISGHKALNVDTSPRSEKDQKKDPLNGNPYGNNKSVKWVNDGDNESDVYGKAGSPYKKSQSSGGRETWWYKDGVIYLEPGGSGGQRKVSYTQTF